MKENSGRITDADYITAMNRVFLTIASCLWVASTSLATEWIDIPAGAFLMGSTPAQVDQGYRISAAGYGHDRVRQAGWFDDEVPQKELTLPAYRIMKTMVTQAEYALFVKQAAYAAPSVDEQTWLSYRLIHPYADTAPYQWHDGSPPTGKEKHPVVLVSFYDAVAYARWLSKQTGRSLRLPTEAEWEKAMRGTDGRLFPWSNVYDADRLNNADNRKLATMPVDAFPAGASPYGVLDGAGEVFEWTATPRGRGNMTVKGGSWDDHGGICRVAAHHERPVEQKHILIGFRLVDVTGRVAS